MLEDLTPPAPRIGAPAGWRPSVQFDETIGQGEAVTPGLFDEPNFDAFLEQAGYDPALYEVVGNTLKDITHTLPFMYPSSGIIPIERRRIIARNAILFF